MAADIVEGAYPSVSAPHDQQCRVEPRQLAYEIVARPRNTVVVADRQPCAAEDSGEFLLEGGVGVERVEERVGVGRRGIGNVAALRVEDHRNVRRDRLQREREDIHRSTPISLEEREIRFVRAHVRRGRTDDAAKKTDSRLRSAAERFGDRRGFGIETDTEDAFVRTLRRTELCEEGQLSRI